MPKVVRALSILLILFSALPTHAQFTGVQPLTLSIAPLYPRPYETVVVTPASTIIDLSAANVTISVNGRVVEQGSGVQRVPVTIGGPGQTTTITVSAVTGGQTYTKTLSVLPGDVALVKEPVSTAHPFYQGAKLTAPEGRVRLIAITDLRTSVGTRIDPANLVYNWKQGDRILQEQSGIGKSVLVAQAPVRYRDAQISLIVTSQDSAVVAQAATVVAGVDPVLRLYRKDALLGTLFDTALPSSYTLQGTEESFAAVPYFFAAQPLLAWTVNGQSSGGERSITVRSAGTGAGSATLGIRAQNSDSHQSASGIMTVLFGSNRPSIFGF